MDVYTANLAGLLALCGGLFWTQRQQQQQHRKIQALKAQQNGKGRDAVETSSASQASAKPQSSSSSSHWAFLAVYALVMASDWLQVCTPPPFHLLTTTTVAETNKFLKGPFLYSLYREEHALSSSTISALFTTGFLSGAASGSFVGSLADRKGRKAACLSFCVVYSLSCVLTATTTASSSSGSVFLLFAGRALGGLGTSLLFSVFESWMVADLRAKGREDVLLEGVFGTMSVVNSLVAIVSGVVSEWLVGVSGTRKAPFWAAVGCLGLAFGGIWWCWVSIMVFFSSGGW